MRLPVPRFTFPPEIYEAIIREHGRNPMRMGEVLMSSGWSIGEAAWAAVNWDLHTLAAAVANERDRRKTKLTSLSETDVAELKKQIQAGKKNPAGQPHRKTTRLLKTPRIASRPFQKPPDHKP